MILTRVALAVAVVAVLALRRTGVDGRGGVRGRRLELRCAMVGVHKRDRRRDAHAARAAADALPCAAASCKLLDVGCGTGALAHQIARRHPRWDIVCSDLRPRCCGRRRLGLGSARASEALPFDAGAFDVVTSLSSFHFWDEPAVGLRELHRVLRPDGALLISDWSHDFISCKICGLYLWAAGFPSNDWNIYSSARMRDLLRAAEFSVAEESIYQIELRPFGMRRPALGHDVPSATRGAQHAGIARTAPRCLLPYRRPSNAGTGPRWGSHIPRRRLGYLGARARNPRLKTPMAARILKTLLQPTGRAARR